MYRELYQYLVQHKELPLPGIGTFIIERRPAAFDFPNKLILQPAYSVRLRTDSYIPGPPFFGWLAANLGVSTREAIFRYNDFTFDLRKNISEGGSVDWKGIGHLSKALSGEVKFVAAHVFDRESPVKAERIIRENAEHMVRVGEDQRSSTEMTAYLNQQNEKKIIWWGISLAIAILALMFIGWYLSEHGIESHSVANTSKLVPGTSSGGYKILP